MPPSSRGLGHHPFKVEIAGSNPAGGTTSRLQSHRSEQETGNDKLANGKPLVRHGDNNWQGDVPACDTVAVISDTGAHGTAFATQPG